VGFFDGNVYVLRSAFKHARTSHPAEWIPLTSDIETRLQRSEPVTRQSMGLESATTISATFGNLQDAAGTGYLRVLTEVLKRFPTHFHVFAGSGNVRSIRSRLHSDGVLPRVRFLGELADIAPLVGIVDVYLASFPQTGDQPIVDAMGAGKPVVVLRGVSDSKNHSGPELVGIRELIAPGEADYIEIVDRLLRTSAFRAAQGKGIFDRFRSEFSPERMGERYKAFLERF
jgi:predicted O-linked N-acetylglucosamine transferase (SPINDLY family)